jgi:nicotinate-nucleotide adenylyltransferase
VKTGIFGGTFNPIHYGHLRTAEELRYRLGLDRIIFIPAGTPPLKRAELVPAAHRLAMTCLAVEKNSGFLVSAIEINREECSYTVNTIRELRALYPEDELLLILGIDAFLDIPLWWQPDELLAMVDFAVVTRPGFDIAEILKSPYIQQKGQGARGKGQENISEPWTLKGGRRLFTVPVTPLGISSTAIRALIREGKSIRYLLPEAVAEYIAGHGLYRQAITKSRLIL